MDELEAIRRMKLEELQEHQLRQVEDEAQMQQQLGQLEQAVKGVLSKEALERFGNIRAAHPEKARHLVIILAQLMQSGRISSAVTDEQLKGLLRRIEQGKKDITITRK